MSNRGQLLDSLLEHAGTTFAEQVGITLRDTPAPLYRLLVMSVLCSAPIQGDLALAAARELGDAGLGTPQKMLDAGWQQRVDVLGRAHYRRYDESTATALGEGAQLLLERWSGDLRRLRQEAAGDPDAIRRLLTEFPRVGPTGAAIFCREAQGLWAELRPALDGKALEGADALGLPTDPVVLADLVAPQQLPALAAALTRAALDPGVRREVGAAAR